MPKPLTYNDALRRLMRGQHVPQGVYHVLERAGLFRWRRGRRVLTHSGRSFLRSGERVAA